VQPETTQGGSRLPAGSGPHLLAGAVAQELERLVGPEKAADVLMRAIQRLPLSDAVERLLDTPSSVRDSIWARWR
jgi:hypothetical protein